jgi:hypothetical protein
MDIRPSALICRNFEAHDSHLSNNPRGAVSRANRTTSPKAALVIDRLCWSRDIIFPFGALVSTKLDLSFEALQRLEWTLI